MSTNPTLLSGTCQPIQPYCQVRRIEYRTADTGGESTWSLERNCSSDCRPFCVTMGGRTKITYCSSCCRLDGLPVLQNDSKNMDEGLLKKRDNSRCNIDNGALKMYPHFSSVVINIILFQISTICCLCKVHN
ncbi:uncharacterized protein LOC111709561 [Eurytemora carolleeae]|uniref:uncharacterized protein LOC111709561 n=1 Tax=Eurytemora carolleeae TaxID=1294199 RepID=UPI000C762B10|nr:uncharacterized protein LOC111709561 [Eurytemora carolleeae]|eukprot:XP_023339057.1 uncharacterized protein LOC111709561 [Eurytemora affinis]